MGSGLFDLDLVDITPHPVLSRFNGANDGVVRGMEVTGRVFVFGRIAAADVAALETHTKVNPAVADFEAVFAAFGGRPNVVNRVQMGAAGSHRL
jgi:hypothetical protein